MQVSQKAYQGDIEFVLGVHPIERFAVKAFSEDVILFLGELSDCIRKNAALNQFADLKAFAFWCRSSNLRRIKGEYESCRTFVGRGIALHITPSNVAMNFAYSLVFGLLAGNVNIVRLPSRNFLQVDKFIEILNGLLGRNEYARIRTLICLIKFSRSDEISKHFSLLADVRLIWGGDETIQNFKKFPTKARCVDLNFPERYSVAIINPEEMINFSHSDMKNFVRRFYNDAYLMDQKGCSSPQAVIWAQKGFDEQKETFWNSLSDIVDENYDLTLSVTADKLVQLTKTAVSAKADFQLMQSNFKVIRLKISALDGFDTIKCSFGMFAEASVDSLDKLTAHVTDRFQTVTFFGMSRSDIIDALARSGFVGVDRVVPVGRAFDMGHIWDGFDTISILSRAMGE